MAALGRLSLASLFLGGGIVLLFLTARLSLRILLLLPCGILGREVGFSPPRGKRLWAAFLFFKDFFTSLLVFLIIIVFLFWQAEGVPRLFVFIAVALGAYLANRYISRPFAVLERRILPLLGKVLFRVFLPARVLFAFFRRFLVKSSARMIKSVKGTYTMHRARRYMRRAPRAMAGRRQCRRIGIALQGMEETRYVG